MPLSFHELRFRLTEAGVWPASRLAYAAWYLLGLDVLLFLLQRLLMAFGLSFGQSLGGWVSFLSFVVIVLFAILGLGVVKARLLWRLRNRLIVTYVFIGVIPVVLLVGMALITLYLFAGQFANFVVTSDLDSRLHSLEAVNTAIAQELAMRMAEREPATARSLEGLKRRDRLWARRQTFAWRGGQLLPLGSAAGTQTAAFALPSFLGPQFGAIVSDHGQLYLRAASTIAGPPNLTVISSEPLDQELLERAAANIGEVTLLATTPGPTGFAVTPTQPGLHPIFTIGSLPPAGNRLDRVIGFPTPLHVVDWATGQPSRGAALFVQTRPSALYSSLFSTLGDFVQFVEDALLAAAIVFGIIEVLALFIGTRLTRTVTGAIAQLYEATGHINRGDFSHRIPVKTNDQLAALANSFNSMASSIEKLIEEQKQKQRLQNELNIAQEVQAQLFPRRIAQLDSLEVYGFCRPARTVSGDYYDFVTMNSHQMLLAVGDISGKGISAALLMATVHSAVRAYAIEGVPLLREPATVAAGRGSDGPLTATAGVEASPGAMLSLLNHQLYESTPAEKYATLFLSFYDGKRRTLFYSNGGHLPPVILSEDGKLRRLERGGMPVGLFDRMNYEESSARLVPGEILLAYSDGVTEPENDFGEFGEHRLVELVHENRDLPLERISEIVTAAVDDWIGPNEQPDDVTIVLARAR